MAQLGLSPKFLKVADFDFSTTSIVVIELLLTLLLVITGVNFFVTMVTGLVVCQQPLAAV